MWRYVISYCWPRVTITTCIIITHVFILSLYRELPVKSIRSIVLKSCYRVLCSLTGNRTPSSAQHFASSLRQEQSAKRRSLHRPTRGWDSGGEHMQIAFKPRKLHGHVFVGRTCVDARWEIFREPTRTKWHPGPMTVRRRLVSRLTGREAGRCRFGPRKKAIVMPGSGFGPVDVIVLHNSWSVQPLSTNGPLLIICLLTDSAVKFQELRPQTLLRRADTQCCNRHDSGKVNCLKLKQAGDLLQRPDKVLNEWSERACFLAYLQRLRLWNV